MLASGQTSTRQLEASVELTEPRYLACTGMCGYLQGTAVAPQGWLPWIQGVFYFYHIPSPKKVLPHCLVPGLMLLGFPSGWVWRKRGGTVNLDFPPPMVAKANHLFVVASHD